jgi:Zn-dependent alcohol dehydrogenases
VAAPGLHGAGWIGRTSRDPLGEMPNFVRVPTGVSQDAEGSTWVVGPSRPIAHSSSSPDSGSGEELLVYGAGGVGLSAIMIARALGARTTVIDPDPQAPRSRPTPRCCAHPRSRRIRARQRPHRRSGRRHERWRSGQP